jgi:hypothetical protein
MAYDFSALTTYINQTANAKLLRKSIYEAETAKIIDAAGGVQQGVKTTTTVNIIDNQIVLQNSAGQVFTPSGSTKITQRQLVPGRISVMQDFKPALLDQYFTEFQLKPGAYAENTTDPFEETFTGLFLDEVAALNETGIWRGNINSSNPQLTFYDGLAKNIILGTGSYGSGSNQVLTGSASNITFSGSAAITVVDAIYNGLPAQILGKNDVAVFMGYDWYRAWTTAVKNQNLFHYTTDSANYETFIPGTNVTIKAVHGLDNSNFAVGLRKSNMRLGVDLSGDTTNVIAWYSNDFKAVRVDLEYKYSTQICFPEECAYFTISGSVPY